MKKKKHRFSRLQIRSFASYLAIMLIVMIALVAYAYRSFSSFHARILLNDYQARLHLLEEAQEQLTSTLISIAGQMTNNDITPVRYAEDPVKASRISGKLASYRAVNENISEIFVHFTGDDSVYSSTSFFRMDRFVSQALTFGNTAPETLENALEKTVSLTIWPMQEVRGYAVRSDSGIHQVMAVLTPLSYPGGTRVGTVMYLVDENVVEGWIRKFRLDEADVTLFHGEECLTRWKRAELEDGFLTDSLQTRPETVTVQGRRYHLLYESGGSNLSCAAMIDHRELGVALNNSVKALILVAAIAAAIAVLLSTRFVQSRMKGINLLRSMLATQTPTDNELIEIRDGIQRLIDENATMSTRMENMVGAQRSEFVIRFLQGGFADEDAFLQMAETVAVNVDTRYFAVAIVAKAAESSYELTPEKIDRLFDERVSGASVTPLSSDSLVLAAFANEPEELREFLEAKFAGLKACTASMTMGISAFHSGWQEGRLAYLEAENAFEARFVKGNTAPVFFAELGEKQTSESDYSRQAVDRLRQALRKGDDARVEEALKEVSQAIRGTGSSLFGFRCMYSEIMAMVSEEARASGIKEEEMYDLFRLSRCLSVDELDSLLGQVCRKIASLQAAPEQAEAPEAIRKAREIIQRRFSEPGLTVSGIAEEVGMSDSRLSVAFKQVYQETPMECITFSRMHRAQRLLRDTEMPVKDIATECGYYDISAFNRSFKSYTGQTPQQFRQQ